MKRYTSLLLAALLLVVPLYTYAAVYLDIGVAANDGGWASLSSTYSRMVQSFIAPDDGDVDSINFIGYKNSGTYVQSVHIYSDSSGNPGSDLGGADIDTSLLSGSCASSPDYVFDTPISLSSGVHYWIVWQYEEGTDDAFVLCAGDGDQYSDGAAGRYNGSYSYPWSGEDYSFVLNGTVGGGGGGEETASTTDTTAIAIVLHQLAGYIVMLTSFLAIIYLWNILKPWGTY